MNFDPASAAARGLARCHSCGRVEPVATEHCPRCHAPLHLRKPESLQRTIALTIGALILYLPANFLPVLHVESTLKGAQQNTILGGVVQFWQNGDYLVALIIFIASVMIPILKVLAIAALCWGARSGRVPRAMTRLYRVTDYIGRWSMVDVFVVAILVGVVQLGGVMTINAGEGALAFAGVVVLTMLAAHAFDPRLIWDAAAPEQRTAFPKNERRSDQVTPGAASLSHA
jgi:paraquat-inducible protein A